MTVISRCVQGNLTCARAAELLSLIASAYQTAQEALAARQSSGSGARQPRTPQPPPPARAGAPARRSPGPHHLHRLQRSSPPRKTLRGRRLLSEPRNPAPSACARPVSVRPANAALPLIASAVCARPAKANWSNSTARLTTGSKAAARASPLWACRTMLPAKSSPPSSSPRKPPTAISPCCKLLRRYGVPIAFYGDRSGVFTRNDDHWSIEEQLAGKRKRGGAAGSRAPHSGVLPPHSDLRVGPNAALLQYGHSDRDARGPSVKDVPERFVKDVMELDT